MPARRQANGSLLAAGLVDELSVLVAPALDGADEVQWIVTAPGGLADKLRLSLLGARTLDHGVVHLRYRVLPTVQVRAGTLPPESAGMQTIITALMVSMRALRLRQRTASGATRRTLARFVDREPRTSRGRPTP